MMQQKPSHREGFLKMRLGGETEGFTKVWCVLDGCTLRLCADSRTTRVTLGPSCNIHRTTGRDIEISGAGHRSSVTLHFGSDKDALSWSEALATAKQQQQQQHRSSESSASSNSNSNSPGGESSTGTEAGSHTRHHHSHTTDSAVPLEAVPMEALHLHRSMTFSIPNRRRTSPANSSLSQGGGNVAKGQCCPHQSPSTGTSPGPAAAGTRGAPIPLVDLVRKHHKSNERCCDCNSTESVEWISINLLCVVCIKCSGAHRSLGSHISKVRSLTLDNFTSPEVLHLLLHHVSNANVNSVYESIAPHNKITSHSSDAERSQFIVDKYKEKMFVDDGGEGQQVSFRRLVKAIHLNSVYMLQRCLAQSGESLREMVQEQALQRPDEKLPTIFQYSLKHHDMVHGRPVYYITEFLLFNGLPVDEFPQEHANSDLPMFKYWRKRFETYGTYQWVPKEKDKDKCSPLKDRVSEDSLSYTPEKNASKRWSLNAIPTTAQVIMAPTNLLTAHRSLRLPKRGHSNSNRS